MFCLRCFVYLGMCSSDKCLLQKLASLSHVLLCWSGCVTVSHTTPSKNISVKDESLSSRTSFPFHGEASTKLYRFFLVSPEQIFCVSFLPLNVASEVIQREARVVSRRRCAGEGPRPAAPRARGLLRCPAGSTPDAAPSDARRRHSHRSGRPSVHI